MHPSCFPVLSISQTDVSSDNLAQQPLFVLGKEQQSGVGRITRGRGRAGGEGSCLGPSLPVTSSSELRHLLCLGKYLNLWLAVLRGQKLWKIATLFLLYYKSNLIAVCKVGTNQIMAVLPKACCPVLMQHTGKRSCGTELQGLCSAHFFVWILLWHLILREFHIWLFVWVFLFT